ncbi:MAG TPA: G5 domain-containing protein [Anaerolineales bacterium]
MRLAAFTTVLGLLFLTSCGASDAPTFTLVTDSGSIRMLARSRIPAQLIAEAGVQVAPGDLILNHGFKVDPNAPVPVGEPIQLQIIEPISLRFEGASLTSTASSVGEFLQSRGVQPYAADVLEPAAAAALTADVNIIHNPSRELILTMGGRQAILRSGSTTIGGALAEGGYPALGLDVTTPALDASPPNDGAVRLSRILETVSLQQEAIPYETRTQESGELEIGTEQILQPGRPGLAVTRTRTRFADGVQISAETEPRVTLRPAEDRIVAKGTKIVEKTATVDGRTITYWRAVQMYATVYSPCNSGTGDGSCSSGTASGLRAGKGVVAVDPGLYAVLNGQRLYIPGYGFAVIGDVGGGYIVEQNLGVSRYRWIDLGFDDNNIQDMTGWITVYFLAPAPASIPEVIR